ncbi:MAG: WYL domain-containing protein [Acidimicrobiia bacterium]
MAEAPRDRVLRVLAMLSWLTRNTTTTVGALTERFDVSRQQLLKDLESLIPFCGLPPYTPDRLIDVTIDGESVEVRFAEYFDDPISLTAEEGLNVVLSAEGLFAADPGNEPLESAIRKLRAHLGVEFQTDFDAIPEIATVIATAIEQDRTVDMTYYSFHRDETTERVVDPLLRFWADGNWYMAGYCHTAQASRFFRFDRIRHIGVGADPRTHTSVHATQFWDEMDTTRVLVSCPEEIGRSLERMVSASRESLSESRWSFAVSEPLAIDRLIVMFGKDLQVLEPESLAARGQTMAARVLTKYQDDARLPQ